VQIRRTVYRRLGQPITLAFISGIDGHPEHIDVEPAPAPPKIPRPPRYSVSRKRKPDSGFEAVLRRIESGGV